MRYSNTKRSGSNTQSPSTNGGIVDLLAKKITANKYATERHAYSLDSKNLGSGYNFVGPGTNLQARANDTPLNSLDRAAKAHDYAYLKEGYGYAGDRNKPQHMKNIWDADKKFMSQSFLNKDDPVMGTIASGLIGAKMFGEKMGILDPKTFSGIYDGMQPMERLGQRKITTRSLTASTYKPKGGAAFRRKDTNLLWDKY